MKRLFQQVAVFAAATVTGTALMTLSGPTAYADHAECSRAHDMRQSVTGSVHTSNKIDTWMSVSTSTSRTFTLTMTGGDANLAILDANCLLIFCDSTNSGSTTETCTVNVPGPLFPQVEWISGTVVDYTLTTNAPSTTSAAPIVSTTTYPSDDCTSNTGVTGGASNNLTFRLLTERVGDETWVCFRADAAARFGGKLVIKDPAAPSPTTDSAADSCATTPGNTVPGSHPAFPIVVGNPGDPGYFNGFVDLYGDSDELWLCLRADSTDVRVAVATGSAPTATVYLDTGAPHPVGVPAGDPNSGSCQASGSATRIADVTTVDGTRAYLYLWRTSTDSRVCVRAGDYGGVLTVVDTLPVVPQPVVTQTTSCASNVATVGQTQVSTSGSSTSASVCLRAGSNAHGVTFTWSVSTPPRVTWTPDAGTPG